MSQDLPSGPSPGVQSKAWHRVWRHWWGFKQFQHVTRVPRGMCTFSFRRRRRPTLPCTSSFPSTRIRSCTLGTSYVLSGCWVPGTPCKHPWDPPHTCRLGSQISPSRKSQDYKRNSHPPWLPYAATCNQTYCLSHWPLQWIGITVLLMYDEKICHAFLGSFVLSSCALHSAQPEPLLKSSCPAMCTQVLAPGDKLLGCWMWFQNRHISIYSPVYPSTRKEVISHAQTLTARPRPSEVLQPKGRHVASSVSS